MYPLLQPRNVDVMQFLAISTTFCYKNSPKLAKLYIRKCYSQFFSMHCVDVDAGYQLKKVHDDSRCTDDCDIVANVDEVDLHWCPRERCMTDLRQCH